MSRAWPFEDRDEKAPVRTPEEFIRRYGHDGSEAILIRIGANDAQLVLVDGEGRWDRWVYRSMEEARRAAEPLGLPVHEGEYPEETRVRINAYRPPPERFEHPYPEQGEVGPIIPYPENRPRRVEDATKERTDPSGR